MLVFGLSQVHCTKAATAAREETVWGFERRAPRFGGYFLDSISAIYWAYCDNFLDSVSVIGICDDFLDSISVIGICDDFLDSISVIGIRDWNVWWFPGLHFCDWNLWSISRLHFCDSTICGWEAISRMRPTKVIETFGKRLFANRDLIPICFSPSERICSNLGEITNILEWLTKALHFIHFLVYAHTLCRDCIA